MAVTHDDLLHLTTSSSWRVEPHSFAERASAGRWRCYPYLKRISRAIGRAVARGGGQIIVNVPPQHGKSQFISRWTPQWFLDNFPERQVQLAGYSAPQAMSWGRQVRNDMLSASGGIYRTRLARDKRQAGMWYTDKGGGMLCGGVGGAFTGFSAHLALIDDPVKNWEEAWSETKRQRAYDWYRSTFSTRFQMNTVVVLLMTRWHVMDLAGQLINDPDSGAWEVIRFPALAEANDPLGRAEGEALVPERYNREWLLRKSLQVGPAVWHPVYQQDPRAALGGRLFRHFTDANVDTETVVRDELPLALTFDFNINPGMHCELAQHDPFRDVFWFLDEIHEPRLDVRNCIEIACKRWVEPALARWRARKGPNDRVGAPTRGVEVHVYGDPSGGSESITRSEAGYDLIRARLRQYGGDVTIAERVAKRQPVPKDRVEALQDALYGLDGVRRVFVSPRCARLLADLRLVLPDPEGGPDKSNPMLTHASEAAMFMVWFLRPIGGAAALGLRGGVGAVGHNVRQGGGLPGIVS